MTTQRITNLKPDDRPPWTPLGVSLIALLFPAGGAILAVRNLQRLRHIDAATSRHLVIAIVALFAIGFSVLLSVGQRTGTSVPQINSTSALVLSIGVAVASYVVQQKPYQAWRARNSGTRTSAWIGALGRAVVYELIAAIIAVPILVAATLATGTAVALS
ncbi:MAG: hypothetical protein ACRDFX_00075 [Chloroflexota bacterium]